ncbi:Fibronectin type-III domain-containing protein [Salinibacterium sp. NYA9b]
MIRTVERTTAQGYRGMKRSTRVSMIAGVAVFLTLVSGVSFAAWTASSTKTATAATGAVALTTATTSGASTISALGPYTYTATNQTVTKPITVRNTGTVDASVSSVTISRNGTLAGNQVAVKFWVGTSSACAATTPVVSSTLAGGTVSLSTLNITLASTGSAMLCASTTFTGNMTSQAGKTTTATFAINSSAGTNWNTTDAMSAANRSFTQDIFQSTVPNAPTATQCANQSAYDEIRISWTAPSGFSTPNGGYNVYYNGTFVANTSSTSIGLSGNGANGNLTVRAVASDGTESADSANIPVEPRFGPWGLACG